MNAGFDPAPARTQTPSRVDPHVEPGPRDSRHARNPNIDGAKSILSQCMCYNIYLIVRENVRPHTRSKWGTSGHDIDDRARFRRKDECDRKRRMTRRARVTTRPRNKCVGLECSETYDREWWKNFSPSSLAIDIDDIISSMEHRVVNLGRRVGRLGRLGRLGCISCDLSDYGVLDLLHLGLPGGGLVLANEHVRLPILIPVPFLWRFLFHHHFLLVFHNHRTLFGLFGLFGLFHSLLLDGPHAGTCKHLQAVVHRNGRRDTERCILPEHLPVCKTVVYAKLCRVVRKRVLRAFALSLATNHPTPQDHLVGKRHERITCSRVQSRVHRHHLLEQAHQHPAVLALLRIQPIHRGLQCIHLPLLRLNLCLQAANDAGNGLLTPFHRLSVLLQGRMGGDQLCNLYSEQVAFATLPCLPFWVVVL
mmetsp:Transcript_8705/g.23656  ORF Transcript_8705/g.23656 Transcript_8705/m.23656 type:complete len:420 (-) Transcript_8705:497-1756(-)